MGTMRLSRSIDMAVGLLRQAFGDPDAWHTSIRMFEAADKVNPPAPGGIVFIGSSSFTFWSTLEKDMASLPVINRGFGGALLADVIHYTDRIVIPYKPKAVVLYAGANDSVGLKAKSPERIARQFCTFVLRVHDRLPDALIFYIAIAPTPSGWKWWSLANETNRLIHDIVATDVNLRFIDLSDLLLGADGQPNLSLYGSHGHLNQRGYERWTSRIKPTLENELTGD